MMFRLAVAFLIAAALVAQDPLGRKKDPVTVAGRVADTGGKPIHGAKITIEVMSEGDWVELIFDDGDTYTTSDGRYEMRKPLKTSDQHRVVASKDNHWLEAPVPFTVGQTNVNLELSPAGSITGSLVLDPSVWPRTVRIEVRRELGLNEQQEDLTLWSPREDGTFKLGPLRRGKYGVRITVDQGRDVLLEVDPVNVKDGELTADPRLQKVDFRSRLKGIKLTIVDEAGKKVEGARVVMLPRLNVSPISHDIHYSSTEVVAMLLRQVPVDVAIVAPGKARVTLRDLDSDAKVVLKAGIPVAVTLQGAGVPEPPLYIQASLELESDTKAADAEARRALGMDQGVDPIAFGADGVARLTAAAPGRYVLLVSAARKVNRVISVASIQHKVGIVEVGSGPVALTVGVSRDQVEEAMRLIGVK